MALDDFIMVTGEEWVEVQNATELVNQGGMDNLTMASVIAGNDWNGVREWAEAVGVITDQQTILNARMIDSGSDVKIWLIVAPLG